MRKKPIRAYYTPAEWLIVSKAARETNRSLASFVKDAALTLARELLKTKEVNNG